MRKDSVNTQVNTATTVMSIMSNNQIDSIDNTQFSSIASNGNWQTDANIIKKNRSVAFLSRNIPLFMFLSPLQQF